VSPARLALRAALMGPALLLAPRPLLWAWVVALATFNALLLAAVGRPFPPGSRSGALAVVALLLALPLEAVLAGMASRALGLAPTLPLPALVLVLFCHLGAFLALLSAGEEGWRERRRLGVQAACWLPLALAAVMALGAAEEALLHPARAAGVRETLLAAGWPRLLLAALLLALVERRAEGGTAARTGREGAA